MSVNIKTSSLKFMKGTPINFEQELADGNTVFVMEFWATWCPPCRATIPHLTELAHKYASKGVKFVGVTNEDTTVAGNFVTKMGAKMDYTVCSDEGGEVEQEFMGKYKVNGIPHAFIVGKDGKVSWHGHPAEPKMVSELEAAISKPGKSDSNANNSNTQSSSNSNATLKPTFDAKKMSKEELNSLPVKELKNYLRWNSIDPTQYFEKSELVDAIQKL